MKNQQFIFNPRFRSDKKSVYFTSGITLQGVKELDITPNIWNYHIYGDYESGIIDKTRTSSLRPTKYESYEILDLGDQEQWYPVYVLLGFKTYPGKYHLEHFMFGDIEIYVSRVLNEVGEPFLKLQGNTTRKVLNLIIRSIEDLKDWIQDNNLHDRIMSLNPSF